MNTIGPLFDPVEGDRLKNEGMERAITIHREDWLAIARRIAGDLAKQGDTTIDDVGEAFYRAYGVAMNDALGNASGSIFRTGFRRVGYRKAERTMSHSRIVSVWRKA